MTSADARAFRKWKRASAVHGRRHSLDQADRVARSSATTGALGFGDDDREGNRSSASESTPTRR
jgi:hypothetical protein